VEAGYQRVTNATKYSASLRNGWQKGYVYSADRATGSALQRDLTYTRDGTFAVDLPNGRYQVVATLGDTKYVRDRMGVFLEGVQVDDVTTNKTLVTRTYTVNVWDGQLTLRLDDLGGSNAYVAVAALRVLTAPVSHVLATALDTRGEVYSLLATSDEVQPRKAAPKTTAAADSAYTVWVSGGREIGASLTLASETNKALRLALATGPWSATGMGASCRFPFAAVAWSSRLASLKSKAVDAAFGEFLT